MSSLKMGVIATAICAGAFVHVATAQQAPTQPKQQKMMPAGPTSAAVMKEIEQTLGFMPQWLRAVPEAQLPAFWEMLKFQMNPNTALDLKTKELVGLAVAAQIPCHYCVQFHTEAARRNGATDQQIREAVGMASTTRMASTMLNGTQIDEAQFRRDTQRMLKMDNKKPQAASR